jgi:arsenate reductase
VNGQSDHSQDAGADSGTAVSGSRPVRVIFVCTGNSARSQMAEALLREQGGDRFDVVSAGVDPRGVHPMTIAALAHVGIDISGATSKAVGMYLGQRFDYVITVCDRARASCPVFPGGSETLHWGIDDPVEAEGTEAERMAVFDRVLTEIARRVRAFVPLALATDSR